GAGATNGVDLDFTGLLTGASQVTKSGAGLMRLSGANTYTGATNISAGTLQIGAGGTTGQLGSSANVLNNGDLAFNGSDTVTLFNAISGTGNLDQNGTGTLLLLAVNTYSGATNVNHGKLQDGLPAAAMPSISGLQEWFDATEPTSIVLNGTSVTK